MLRGVCCSPPTADLQMSLSVHLQSNFHESCPFSTCYHWFHLKRNQVEQQQDCSHFFEPKLQQDVEKLAVAVFVVPSPEQTQKADHQGMMKSIWLCCGGREEGQRALFSV